MEYKVESVGEHSLEARLNALSEEGWRLTLVHPVADTQYESLKLPPRFVVVMERKTVTLEYLPQDDNTTVTFLPTGEVLPI